MAADAGSTPGPGAVHLLSVATPLWLLGLLLIPVIRWLHRRGPESRSVVVSSLSLWQRVAPSTSVAVGCRPPDPAWIRRALLTALLFVTLSGPQLRERHTRITVWIDDSLSMLTHETSGTRLAEGLAQVRAALRVAPPAEVDVRRLADPGRSLGVLNEMSVATIISVAGQQEPAAPPEGLLRDDSLHWLVTDGADAALLNWPGARQPDRLFRIAAVTRNVGLERLSARRNLNDPEQYDVLLKVTNGGTAAETRSVIFATHAGELARSSHRLEAGAYALVNATLPASDKVSAMLQPGDALAADDEIVLSLEPLRRRRVAADPTCPPALLTTVSAHPALALVAQDASGADAALDCEARTAPRKIATIRVLAQRAPTQASGPLQWSSSVPESRRRVETQFLQIAARIKPRAVDTVLLAARDAPLIVSRAGEPLIVETALHFSSARSAGRAEIPLLVNFLFERLFGVDLLNEIATVDRGPNAVKVVPIEPAGGDTAKVPPEHLRDRDVSRLFLVAALLVLLWEIFALGREWRRLRVPTGSVSA